MSDVSGIPNMGFGGGGYFGGIPNQQPAMSAAQINAGMWGNYSPGAAQATQNNIYGAGGFGAQPAYYAGLGAAYGRQTGGFGGYGAANADPFTAVGGGGSQGAPQYDPWTGSITGYNAPRQYGWDANEGAPAPAAPQVYNRGEFNPQTYGWDHNEGAAVPQANFGMNLYGANSGSLGTMSPFGGYSPYSSALSQPFGSIWNRVAPQVPTFPSSVTVPQQQSQGTPQYDPWTGAITGYSGGGGGYDMSAQSRAYQSPLQGFDWAQSYGTRGGANADMLRTAGGASSGYYNPQLDWLSRSTLGMNNQPVDYSHMFGAPSSGYLGSQGRLNQDPFGGYVNPRDLDAGGSFPGNYQPSYNALPLGWNNSFNN